MDQLSSGHAIIRKATGGNLHSVHLITKYVSNYTPISLNQPLFRHCDGRLMVLQSFQCCLREILQLAGSPSSDYNTHIVRIGTATSSKLSSTWVGATAKRIRPTCTFTSVHSACSEWSQILEICINLNWQCTHLLNVHVSIIYMLTQLGNQTPVKLKTRHVLLVVKLGFWGRFWV